MKNQENKFAFPADIQIIFVFIEWLGRDGQYAIEKFVLKWPKYLRWTFYCLIVVSIFLFSGQKQNFIYFQF